MQLTDDELEERRRRYLSDLVATASPAQRLLMLFDRLGRDLSQAEAAFQGSDLKEISDHLVHAQHILFALRDPLDRTTELGQSLHGLYGYCISQLIQANLEKRAALVPPVRSIVESIGRANRQAAEAVALAARREPVGAGA